jgi:hypothetical protein
MPSRRSILFGSIFVAGLAVIAWTEYYPSSPMFTALGMSGPRANSGRECGHEQSFMGWLNRRSIQCRNMWSVRRGLWYVEYADVRGLRRELVYAGRGWGTEDSSRWRAQRDSIVAAMGRSGGREYTCRYAPESNSRMTYRYWRFPTFSTRLIAYSDAPYSPGVGEIHVDGYSNEAPECLSPPRDRSSDAGTCTEAILRMPLPGNRVLCVRSWF